MTKNYIRKGRRIKDAIPSRNCFRMIIVSGRMCVYVIIPRMLEPTGGTSQAEMQLQGN